MGSVGNVALAVALLGIALLAARYPYGALRVLLVLLPLHSAYVLLLGNVMLVGGATLTLLSAWKEAVIVGLAIAALLMLPRRWRSWHPVHWIALVLLAMIMVRGASDLITIPDRGVAILYGARQLGEFLVLLLAVTILRPSLAWFQGTAKLVLPAIVLCAMFAIAQPTLGNAFYDEFFHGPGEQLHHSYLVNIGEMRRLRAVGTFIAPNELGLGVIVYGLIFVLPLMAVLRRWRLVALAAMLLGIALLLSFSRSAWLGLALGVVVIGLLMLGNLRRLWRDGMLVKTPIREILVGLAAAAAGAILIFVLVGGVTLLVGTVSGTESSAAGRGESLGRGLEATFDNPGGLGLGTAGPRALELTGSSVLTENWYFVYSIQLGVIALAVVAALSVASLAGVLGALRHALGRLRPPYEDWLADRYRVAVVAGTAASLVAALVGGVVIPALLDLPASLALWASVGIVIGWMTQRDPDRASE
jgi:hypothetical protein